VNGPEVTDPIEKIIRLAAVHGIALRLTVFGVIAWQLLQKSRKGKVSTSFTRVSFEISFFRVETGATFKHPGKASTSGVGSATTIVEPHEVAAAFTLVACRLACSYALLCRSRR
jgi:hypothetical protein